MATVIINVGKFSRPVEITFKRGYRDTRWDVYPNRPEPVIYVQPFKGGRIFQYDEKTGVWFRAISTPCGGAEFDLEENGIDAASAKDQIQNLVNNLVSVY
jgi:hypothetical protein